MKCSARKTNKMKNIFITKIEKKTQKQTKLRMEYIQLALLENKNKNNFMQITHKQRMKLV